ncbi:hypothetical protein WN51_07777 [Melipona quadrifasciata]|uniref:Uncharacterized protein n=1 Tax=Melipona quadrifasciata TaxID=166423 RepID=A0A0M9A6Q9_9HYME|nr:hypothetical protein WN51_07777 [Melipona quadrifasciata]
MENRVVKVIQPPSQTNLPLTDFRLHQNRTKERRVRQKEKLHLYPSTIRLTERPRRQLFRLGNEDDLFAIKFY